MAKPKAFVLACEKEGFEYGTDKMRNCVIRKAHPDKAEESIVAAEEAEERVEGWFAECEERFGPYIHPHGSLNKKTKDCVDKMSATHSMQKAAPRSPNAVIAPITPTTAPTVIYRSRRAPLPAGVTDVIDSGLFSQTGP